VGKDALHRLAVRLGESVGWGILPIADQLRKPRRNFPQGKDEIGQSGRDRAARHRPIFGLVRVLDQNDAAGLLDRLDADGPVGTGAGKNDGEIVASLRRERAKKEIDRSALPTRFVEFRDRKMLVGR
jgi:hypothetical protein